MTIKALLVDDEAKLRQVLRIKLAQHCPDVEVVGEAANITEAQALIAQLEPQLVFLDIAMPGGSGFDLLDQLPHINFEIIFVTGYNDYVLDALKVSAVDYLLKPVATPALIEAVQRSKTRITDREKIELYHVLRHNIQHLGGQATKISIPGTHAYEFVTIADIVRCEGWQKYTRIYLTDSSCLVSSYNIGVFRDMLGTYGFFSTHKSHLINTQKIRHYLKEGIVIMFDDSKVPVARRKRDDFVIEVLQRSSFGTNPDA
jgi:two-component system LytT family response regulator